MNVNTNTNTNTNTNATINVTTINVKNTQLNDLRVSANSVLLLQQTTSATNNVFIKGVAISGLKNTEAMTIVKHLLTAICAEYRVRNNFNNEFSTLKINGKDEQTGLTAKSLFARYLNTSVIYRSDSNGKIANAIEIAGQTLKDTALKVTNKHLIATCNRNDLRAVIHHQAKAVLAQFRYIDDLNEMINELSKTDKANETTTATATTKEKTAKKTTANKTTAKVTTPATTTTATATTI